jgi:hypothetical protein
MSLDYVAQGRSTRTFAAGHFNYIADQLQENLRQLNQATSSPAAERALKDSQHNVAALVSELTFVSSQTENLAVRCAAKQRIIAIRRALEKTSTSL